MKVHRSPSSLASHITELESSLEEEKKHRQETIVTIREAKNCDDEA